ncbi:RluA family pseudouridine synthase [Lentzea albidocapillata]|uniref:RNA pseudouridylate synthase n=1 Tax=Lentzea albidocapillata TaxID=40571 RepID=A0A1W2FFQ2_9PSEU|nr:RluA family pseudouridine synthase [Lentzea albidocapillata]SMD20741.1 tRNA pseudouridine32 synthase / 23S rRNA pseudouridine746 synthase [Lentzea albidocapillata]
MRRKPSSPLPQRNGLDAARLKLPSEGAWPSLREHLVERLPRVAAERIDEMLAEERIWGVAGPLGVDTPFVPDSYIWFHRDLPVEVPVPFEVGVVYQDDDIVVADKPHFLATIPRGAHIMQTALVKLRESLGLPDLSPAHRLDRVTAGLVLFVVRRELRGKYQTMFRDRLVRKEYEAIAPYDPALEVPRVVRSRIIKERGIITAFEVDGEPNAETHVSLVERRGALGRYHLKPLTGRTHQLRLHMSGLGVPIVNDDFYPVLRDRPLDDFSSPLQLLAHTLSFVDPVSGVDRSFTSGLKLSAWS